MRTRQYRQPPVPCSSRASRWGVGVEAPIVTVELSLVTRFPWELLDPNDRLRWQGFSTGAVAGLGLVDELGWHPHRPRRTGWRLSSGGRWASVRGQLVALPGGIIDFVTIERRRPVQLLYAAALEFAPLVPVPGVMLSVTSRHPVRRGIVVVVFDGHACGRVEGRSGVPGESAGPLWAAARRQVVVVVRLGRSFRTAVRSDRRRWSGPSRSSSLPHWCGSRRL